MLLFDEKANAYHSKLLDRRVDGRVDVEVGDSKQSEFFPQAKLIRHGNSVNLSFRYVGARSFSHRMQQLNKVAADDGEVSVEMYDKSEQESFEIELVLPSKPNTNRFPFSFRSKGVTEWIFQPELTEQEKADGFERPQNVVGSYALYGDQGKLFHLYRPHIVDAGGNECWGNLDLDLSREQVTVVAPQQFLDKAVYPVHVDPTIGYTSVGATYYVLGASNSGSYAATKIPVTSALALVAGYFYIRAHFYSTTTCSFVVFDDDKGDGYSGPGTVLGESAQIQCSNTAAWYTAAISCTTPTSGSVWIGVKSHVATYSFRWYCDSGSTNESYIYRYSGTEGYVNDRGSVYATYLDVISISSVDIAGAGSVAIANLTEVKTVSAAVVGLGTVAVSLIGLEAFLASINGGATVEASVGEVQTASLEIAGTGTVDVVAYEVQTVSSAINGTGTVAVTVKYDDGFIDVDISGDSSVDVIITDVDSVVAGIAGFGVVSVAVIFFDSFTVSVSGSGMVSVSIGSIGTFIAEINGSGRVAVIVDGGEDVAPWQPPVPDTSTPAQKAARSSRASKVTQQITQAKEVVAPLSQQITDAKTGLPTKPMADFMFQVGQRLSSLRTQVEEVTESVAEIITIGPIFDDLENLKKIIDDLIATAYAQGAKIQEFYYTYQSETLSIAQKVEQLTASVATAAAAIRHEQSVRAEENYAMAMDRRILVANVREAETLITKAQASIVNEMLVRATADSALASDMETLQASVNTINGTVAGQAAVISALTASVETLEAATPFEWAGSQAWPQNTTLSGAYKWEFTSPIYGDATIEIYAYEAQNVNVALNGTTIGTMSGEPGEYKWYSFSGNLLTGENELAVWASGSDSGSVKQIRVYRIATVAATASSLLDLESQVNDPVTGLPNAHSRITSEASTRTSADSALASAINTLSTTVAATAAQITSEASTRATADSALASSINTLSTTVGGHTTTLTQQASSIDGIKGRWGVSINSNGHVTAIQLIGSASSSQFIIDADVIINGTLTTEKIEDNAVTVPQIYALTSGSYGVDETVTVTVNVDCPIYISSSFTLPNDNLTGDIASVFIIYVNGSNIYQEESFSGNVRGFNISDMLSAGSNTVRFVIRRTNSTAYGSGYLPRNIFLNLLAVQK